MNWSTDSRLDNDETSLVLSACLSIPGLELAEMERNRKFSLCCGGGGGRFWTETVAEERFSNMRVEEALGSDTPCRVFQRTQEKHGCKETLSQVKECMSFQQQWL
ncbi:MAG: hypothetical protein E3J35_00315 [Methanomassiliicoccales archaeon]|nr:MAG: hypothetical protein E3J35_00315 [Methanomassiliicoccales archaeon]